MKLRRMRRRVKGRKIGGMILLLEEKSEKRRYLGRWMT
jgi:hypothetical protein